MLVTFFVFQIEKDHIYLYGPSNKEQYLLKSFLYRERLNDLQNLKLLQTKNLRYRQATSPLALSAEVWMDFPLSSFLHMHV